MPNGKQQKIVHRMAQTKLLSGRGFNVSISIKTFKLKDCDCASRRLADADTPLRTYKFRYNSRKRQAFLKKMEISQRAPSHLAATEHYQDRVPKRLVTAAKIATTFLCAKRQGDTLDTPFIQCSKVDSINYHHNDIKNSGLRFAIFWSLFGPFRQLVRSHSPLCSLTR